MSRSLKGTAACAGLAGTLALCAALAQQLSPGQGAAATVSGSRDTTRVRFLAVGDINLGRRVGRRILAGDTLYPFAAVRDTFARFDVVFANLESPLSDQNGETERPGHNTVFTGPPAGAEALRRAGITVVSTANNHALDYGVRALDETGQLLRSAGIAYAGTSRREKDLFAPALLTVHGIRLAVFACTDVMNSTGTAWRQYVAPADTGGLYPRLRAIRDSVDFIIVSYHGGTEYAKSPSASTMRFASGALAAGADLFLGHHPHVPYGVREIRGKLAVPSLGNFVFSQPAHEWALRSFGFAADIVKDSSGTGIRGFRCLPVRCGLQPSFALPADEERLLMERIVRLSTRDVIERSSR